MMRITDISSDDRQQLLVPAVLALRAVGATGVLSIFHGDLFRPYCCSWILSPFLGVQILLPGGTASTVVLVLAIVAGIAFVQLDWNIRPSRPVGYWAVLFGLLLGSAALAAYVLRLSKVYTPYETTTLNIVMLLPGIMVVTGVEELLFRQVAFRWLEKQHGTGKETVFLTSAAFGGARPGALLIGGKSRGRF